MPFAHISAVALFCAKCRPERLLHSEVRRTIIAAEKKRQNMWAKRQTSGQSVRLDATLFVAFALFWWCRRGLGLSLKSWRLGCRAILDRCPSTLLIFRNVAQITNITNITDITNITNTSTSSSSSTSSAASSSSSSSSLTAYQHHHFHHRHHYRHHRYQQHHHHHYHHRNHQHHRHHHQHHNYHHQLHQHHQHH